MTTKIRPKVQASFERREALKQYIGLCIRDGALTFTDLKSTKFLDRLLKLLSSDVKAVLGEVGAQSGANLLQIGASMLAGFAENLARKTF